jgi:hypothetical protein
VLLNYIIVVIAPLNNYSIPVQPERLSKLEYSFEKITCDPAIETCTLWCFNWSFTTSLGLLSAIALLNATEYELFQKGEVRSQISANCQ